MVAFYRQITAALLFGFLLHTAADVISNPSAQWSTSTRYIAHLMTDTNPSVPGHRMLFGDDLPPR